MGDHITRIAGTEQPTRSAPRRDSLRRRAGAIIVATAALSLASPSLAAAKIHEVDKPAYATLKLYSIQDAVGGGRQTRDLEKEIAARIEAIAKRNPGRVVAIRVKGLDLQYGDLSSKEKRVVRKLARKSGSRDYGTWYEQRVAKLLGDALDRVKAKGGTQFTVLNLPFDTGSSKSAASNKHYEELIESLDVFVTSQSFTDSGNTGLIDTLAQSMPVAFAEAGDRPIIFRESTAWKMVTNPSDVFDDPADDDSASAGGNKGSSSGGAEAASAGGGEIQAMWIDPPNQYELGIHQGLTLRAHVDDVDDLHVVFQTWPSGATEAAGVFADYERPFVYPGAVLDAMPAGPAQLQAVVRAASGDVLGIVAHNIVFEEPQLGESGGGSSSGGTVTIVTVGGPTSHPGGGGESSGSGGESSGSGGGESGGGSGGSAGGSGSSGGGSESEGESEEPTTEPWSPPAQMDDRYMLIATNYVEQLAGTTSIPVLEQFEEWGAFRCVMIYDGGIDPHDSGFVDLNKLENRINQSMPPDYDGFAMLDLEDPYLDWLREGPESPNFHQAQEQMLIALDFAKEMRPDAKWTFYALPALIIWPVDPENPDAHLQWHETPEWLQQELIELALSPEELLAELEWFAPGCYDLFWNDYPPHIGHDFIQQTRVQARVSCAKAIAGDRLIMPMTWQRCKSSIWPISHKLFSNEEWFGDVVIPALEAGASGVVWWSGDIKHVQTGFLQYIRPEEFDWTHGPEDFEYLDSMHIEKGQALMDVIHGYQTAEQLAQP